MSVLGKIMQETELLIVSFSCMFLLFLSFFFLNIELPHLSKSSSIILFFASHASLLPLGMFDYLALISAPPLGSVSLVPSSRPSVPLFFWMSLGVPLGLCSALPLLELVHV